MQNFMSYPNHYLDLFKVDVFTEILTKQKCAKLFSFTIDNYMLVFSSFTWVLTSLFYYVYAGHVREEQIHIHSSLVLSTRSDDS